MKLWMPIFLNILFLFSVSAFAECGFQKDVKKVISLSGPVTVILKELNLLNDSKMSGISVFHPVKDQDFKGKIYPGGIFLSHSILSEFQNSTVFFDESKELGRLLSSRPSISPQELKTRNHTPLESITKTISILKPYLSGCEEELKKISQKASDIQEEILKKVPANFTAVFYLGEITNERKPELVIVNDGMVKLLLQKGSLKSYPSELSYVNWSSKLMRGMPTNTFHIGIKDTGRNGEMKIKRSSREMTLFYPGALIPGLTQLRAFHYLLNKI